MKEPDRVPVAPSVLTRAIKKAGVKQYDYHTNPEVLANAQILHCDLYDFDGMYISSDNVIMYEALGGKIIYPDEHSYPFWTDPLITKVSDLAKLSVADPAVAGRMPMVIEAARIAVEKAGDRRFVNTNIDSGPFQLASTLMGMESAMGMLVDEPAEMSEILSFCADVAIAYGRGMAKSGCHGIQFGESTAGLIGRRLYEEVVWPQDCRVVEELKKTGVMIFLHVCGDSNAILDLIADTGADCLEIDSQVDMARAKELVRNRVALKGNVNTTSFVEKTIPELLDECRQATLAGKPGGGFILSAGCETPADASEEAINAIREAADLYGAY
jgi:uroporphyrinogen decarboxylase